MKNHFVTSIGKLVLTGFLILINQPAMADSWSDLFQSQSLVEETAARMGPTAQSALDSFKQEVQSNSYENTLKLCEGYRRAARLGPTSYHGQWMYSDEESFGVWANIYKEGLMVLGSSIGGVKREFIDEKHFNYEELGSSGPDKWKSMAARVGHEFFHSAYTLYFVNSMGFAAGAMHCLEVDDPRYITRGMNYFMYTILAMDLAGSFTAELVTGAMIKKLLLTTAGRIIVWPFKAMVNILKNRVFQATAMIWVAFDLPHAIEKHNERQQELIEAKEGLQERLGSPSLLLAASDYNLYGLRLSNAYEVFLPTFQQDMSLHNGDPKCLKILNFENALNEQTSHDLYDDTELRICKRMYQTTLQFIRVYWTEDGANFYENFESEDPSDKLKILVDRFYPLIKGLYPLNI